MIFILAETLLPVPGIDSLFPGLWDELSEASGFMVSRNGFYLPLDEYRFIFWNEIGLVLLGVMALWHRYRHMALMQEKKDLHEAARSAKPAAAPEVKPAESVIRETGDMEPAVETVEEPVIVPNNEVLEAVRVARCTCQEIRFLYRDIEGRVTERMVQPIEVYHRDGHSYLRGWCSLRRDERTFRIDRMVLMASSQPPQWGA